MKPMLKYRGGKQKEIKNLEPYLPSFTGKYIEPFFGGGSMYFHLEPEEAIVSDLNKRLMDFYCGVRNDYYGMKFDLQTLSRQYEDNRLFFEERKQASPDHRVVDDNEALYYQIRDMFNGKVESKYLTSALYYFINKTAYSGMVRYNAKGEFNVPYGRYRRFNAELVTEEHRNLLLRAEVLNLDYSHVFDMANPDDFMFLDPPYDCTFSDYGNAQHRDGFGEEEHRRLAKAYHSLPCKAMMVIGRTPLTYSLYSSKVVGQYVKAYSVNIKNRFKSESRHMVVCNY